MLHTCKGFDISMHIVVICRHNNAVQAYPVVLAQYPSPNYLLAL